MKNDELENLLQNWAYFFTRYNRNELGYPAKNILATIKKDGGQIIGRVGIKPTPTNESAEMIEQFWTELAHEDLTRSNVLKRSYFKKSFFESNKTIAKELGISERTYFRRLDEAKQWIWQRYLLEQRKAA